MRLDAEEGELIVRRRLRAQRLSGAACRRPEDVVGLLGAVQAQDYGPAKWSIGTRVEDCADSLVELAFDSGAILRTHVVRPTWHFVLPEDIRWLLAATAPRIKARDARRYAQLGLDTETLRQSGRVLVAALRGSGPLTRAEAASVLTAAGIDVEGQRLPYLLMHAELDCLICSGPRRGSRHTYVLLEERAPQALDLPREEALAELARRYFSSHGPATAKDFAGWASLTLAEARAAIDAAGASLTAEELDGLRLWSAAEGPGSPSDPAGDSDRPLVHLVQGYDELIMGYSETKALLAAPGSAWTPATPPVSSLVVLRDGRVAGFWRRAVKKDRVLVQTSLLDTWDAPSRAELAAEAERFAAFLGLRLEFAVAD